MWGSISNRVGRKPVLIVGVIGTALSLVLTGLATELWMLFLARVLSGLLASAMLPTTMAYIGELWHALFGPLGILLVVAFIVSFGAINFQAIFGLYALKKFNFDPSQVGTVLVIVGLVGAIVQGALTGPVTKRWGEAVVIKFSFLTNALGFLVLLVANSYETVLLTTGVYTLSHALLRPSVQALTSKHAALGQGAVMGLNNQHARDLQVLSH